LYGLPHYELEGYVGNDLEILEPPASALLGTARRMGDQPLEALLELALDVVAARTLNYVADHLVLGVEDYVTKLPEVLTHDLSVVVLIEEDLA
jgi:hypothetical protein